MKKFLLSIIAGAAVLGIASCAGKQAATETTDEAAATTKKTAYTGILPGADCDGIWYTLQLNGDQYDMIETYFALDTTANFNINELLSVKSEGTVETLEKGGYNYIKLVPSTQDAEICFLNATDSTLVLLNADLETPTAPDYYTLNLVK